MISKEIPLDEYIETVQKHKEDEHSHVKHQTFRGGGYYEKVSEDEAVGYHQGLIIFLAHTDDKHAEVSG